MASICEDPGGRKRILFNGPGRGSLCNSPWEMSRKQADSFKIRLETLIADRIAGHGQSAELAEWIRGPRFGHSWSPCSSRFVERRRAG